MIESLSKIIEWIYKLNELTFSFGVTGEAKGIAFPLISGKNRFRISSATMDGIIIHVKEDGTTEKIPYEKDVAGYCNIAKGYDSPAQLKYVPYDFSLYKRIVIEVQSGNGYVGYCNAMQSISTLNDKQFVEVPNKTEINGAGKYKIDISKINSTNYIILSSADVNYQYPLVINNIYFQ